MADKEREGLVFVEAVSLHQDAHWSADVRAGVERVAELLDLLGVLENGRRLRGDEFSQLEAANPEALVNDYLGEPLTYRRWKRLLSDACQASGVELTSHSLRHFAASALISGGASVKQVQKFLGRSSATITLRTYAHPFPGDEDRTRDSLETALSPLADSVRTEAASDA